MPAKKPKVTDWRIIAMSGKTADGREISARHLQEMASQYNPEKYAARINLEHLRFIFPYPEVTGYGDVVELKAEKQADGKTALLAKLAVNDNLQELWDADQKVFSSIEIHPDFSDTGKAYLVGVAVTDSPASLGTTRHFSVSGAEAVAATQSIQFSEYTEMSESAKKAQKVGLFAALLATFAAKPAESHAAAPPQEVAGQKSPPAEPETNEEQKESYAALLQKIEAQQAELGQAAEFAAELLKQFNELRADYQKFKGQVEAETVSGERAPHVGAAADVSDF